MKYIIALASGFFASIVVGFVLAVILGILNIYFTGHGIHWPSDEFHWRFIRMSTLDAEKDRAVWLVRPFPPKETLFGLPNPRPSFDALDVSGKAV